MGDCGDVCCVLVLSAGDTIFGEAGQHECEMYRVFVNSLDKHIPGKTCEQFDLQI